MVDRCRCVVVRVTHFACCGPRGPAVRHDLLIGVSMGAIGSVLAIAAGICALVVAAEHHDPILHLGD